MTPSIVPSWKWVLNIPEHGNRVPATGSGRPRTGRRTCQPTGQTLHSLWLLFLVSLVLPNWCMQFAEAQCRTRSGLPMCCLRHQPNCSSYTLDTSVSAVRSRRHLATLPRKRCFCDEHCMVTNDCCPDYRQVCQKPVVDCHVSEWGPWTECNRQCGPGFSVRRRRVIQMPAAGGQSCPVLEERKPCHGQRCSSRRVGRSGALMIPYMNQAAGEVAQLLPVRGDVMQMLRQHDMRWDVRRKLYLGRLIQQNRTEQPEPEPYCAVYEITYANPACETHNLLWQYTQDARPNSYVPYRTNYYSYGATYPASRHRSWESWTGQGNYDNSVAAAAAAAAARAASTASAGPHSKRLLSDWGMSNTWSHVWMNHAALLTPGQQICVTCYPAYIRCPSIGFPEMDRRWRALRTADCQGTYRLVSGPQSQCTCGQGVSSFVFV